MDTKAPFSKTYASPSDLVQLLQARGLAIEDAVNAQAYLQHIGYYRLSAYMYPLSPQNDMAGKVKSLLAAFPDVDMAAMGFPSEWESEPLWGKTEF